MEFASQQHVHRLDQLSLLLLEKFRVSQKKAGYADKTLQHRMVVVKQLVKWAEERDILNRNPLKGLKIGKAKAAEQPCFTPGQVEVILKASSGQEKSIFEVLAFTGMRIGEQVWLTWQDVDFEKNTVQIRPKNDWMPKNGRSRVIPRHKSVRKVLETLPKNHRWVFTAGKSKLHPRGGGQVNPNHILERLKRLLKKTGFDGHLHTFRHFFASYCANNGVPAFQLIKWLGHGDVSMVMHYYELHDEESQWTMQKLSQSTAVPESAALRELEAG